LLPPRGESTFVLRLIVRAVAKRAGLVNDC
jgi:hypothetical protein